MKQMWFATQPVEEPDNPSELVETIMHYSGEDRTVFASDWPHHDFDHPRALLKLPLTAEQRHKILAERRRSLPGADPREARGMSEQRVPEGHVIGPVSDFPVVAHKVVKVRNIEIGVFNVHGTFYALPNICPHQYGPLCTGPVGGLTAATPGPTWRFQWEREALDLPLARYGIRLEDRAVPRAVEIPRAPLPGARGRWRGTPALTRGAVNSLAAAWRRSTRLGVPPPR